MEYKPSPYYRIKYVPINFNDKTKKAKPTKLELESYFEKQQNRQK